MAAKPAVRLIFPHQLFTEHYQADKNTVMVLIEDDLFFKQYKFHVQKLLLHRASMQYFAAELARRKFRVEVIETGSRKSMAVLEGLLQKIQPSSLSYYDVVDDWLQQRLDEVCSKRSIIAERIESPGFLTSRGLIDDYFGDGRPKRMKNFYAWQRKRLNILLDGDKPVGGKWSFDEANRKKLPKYITLPKAYPAMPNDYVDSAQKWLARSSFAHNPGTADTFDYPVTHDHAAKWLADFLQYRLATFGPYEDAIAEQHSQLFHSVLSPLINIGLLTPRQVVDETLSHADTHNIPIASLEGFIRQVIGWREYMRATYVQYGRQMRSANKLAFGRKLSKGWWDGTTGIGPIDAVIKRTLDTAYAHHIERLMILGNSMVLMRIDPDEVYEWFMSLFIDAYDWVMVPNVYAMSQFAAGDMITTKPYISGSNYVLKMSDFKRGDWTAVWDALYWQFIDDHRPLIQQNYRLQMVVKTYDRFTDSKKRGMKQLAKQWLA